MSHLYNISLQNLNNLSYWIIISATKNINVHKNASNLEFAQLTLKWMKEIGKMSLVHSNIRTLSHQTQDHYVN